MAARDRSRRPGSPGAAAPSAARTHAPIAPPERTATTRQQLREALDAVPRTVRELSPRAGLSERQVAEGLPHLARSLAAEGRTLTVSPAWCLACRFNFDVRFERPSRCPKCRSERLAPPRFSLG